ncbi:MAG: hypothetical protein HQL22_05905 [Candidatus Omnitrophica bacterium]|nr:hypothetical protein [Candidatus Omnitrophota bacterium]
MNKWIVLLLCANVFLLGVCLAPRLSKAAGPDFHTVIPFYSTGSFGFFDQKDGGVYFYNRDLKKPVRYQVVSLDQDLVLTQK